MSKKDLQKLSEKKELIMDDILKVLEKHGATGISLNITMFKEECTNGGDWVAYTVYDKRRKKYVTKYKLVCR